MFIFLLMRVFFVVAFNIDGNILMEVDLEHFVLMSLEVFPQFDCVASSASLRCESSYIAFPFLSARSLLSSAPNGP